MLSTHTIKSGTREREAYYTEDESLADDPDTYYSEEETPSASHPLTRSQWHGKGAITLGLEGEVQREDFKEVFYGLKPGTKERIRWEKQNPEDQERLAEDFTFSAPKSVAIALHLN
ncbi:MAG TPA: relaxase domain-containing protein, partial [Stenomitos sp.]